MKQNLFSDDAVRLDILRQRSYSMRWASLPEDVIPLSSADPDFRRRRKYSIRCMNI